MIRVLIFLVCASSLFASTLYLATSSNPSRINPILATDSSSSEIAGFIFNGLVKFDKDSKGIIGDLAKKFYFENDTTLVFELRENVLWHDGEKFSVDDVIFTYETLMSKSISSPYSADFRFVKELVKVNDYSFKVIYTRAYFKAIEIWGMGILPKHILEDEKNLMSAKFNTSPIGTGPYRLESLEHSKNIVLSANPHYFLGKAKIDTISFQVIADTLTRFLMLKSSALDIGNIEALAYERQLLESFFDDFEIHERMTSSYTYLGFNLRREKFQDARVREALSLAIDRKKIVDILFFKHAQVATGPFHPATSAFNPNVKAPQQDVTKAKRLLQEAGYNEENPFEFEIVTSNSSSVRPYVAQILQYQLKKVGVNVRLRVMEWQAFLNMVVMPHDFDSVLLGWGLSVTPDPYNIWHSDSDTKGGFNLIGYKNEKLDKLIESSQSIVNREKISKLWREMFEIIVDDNPYLFLYIPNSITAVNKNIKNIQPSVSGIWHNQIQWQKEIIK